MAAAGMFKRFRSTAICKLSHGAARARVLRVCERNDTPGVVVARAVRVAACRMHPQHVLRRGTERHIVAGEPALEGPVREHHRHPVMQRSHGVVGLGGEDGEGLDELARPALGERSREAPRPRVPATAPGAR